MSFSVRVGFHSLIQGFQYSWIHSSSSPSYRERIFFSTSQILPHETADAVVLSPLFLLQRCANLHSWFLTDHALPHNDAQGARRCCFAQRHTRTKNTLGRALRSTLLLPSFLDLATRAAFSLTSMSLSTTVAFRPFSST